MKILSLGELLVELARIGVDEPHSHTGEYAGPFPSGAPAIFIDAAARLGASAGFVGVVGEDEFGDCLLERLAGDGVDLAWTRRAPGLTTGIAFVAYRSDGSRKYVFNLAQSAAAQLSPADVDPAYFSQAKWLHITGSALSFSESSRQACYKAVQIVKQSGGQVSFDPNLRPELIGMDSLRALVEPVLRASSLLLPSGAEASMLAGLPDEAEACRSLVGDGVPLVALKQGKKGSTIFSAGEEIHVDSIEVAEVDPTGAGDRYGGAFVAALLEGQDVQQAARIANVVGALSVSCMGAMEGIPDRQTIMQYL